MFSWISFLVALEIEEKGPTDENSDSTDESVEDYDSSVESDEDCLPDYEKNLSLGLVIPHCWMCLS